MKEKAGNKKRDKIRNFFKGLVEKLDKKMEDKAKRSNCCSPSEKKGNNSCCS